MRRFRGQVWKGRLHSCHFPLARTQPLAPYNQERWRKFPEEENLGALAPHSCRGNRCWWPPCVHFSQGRRREHRSVPTRSSLRGVIEDFPSWKDFRPRVQRSPELELRWSDETLLPFSQNGVFSPEPHHRSEEGSSPVLECKQWRIRQKNHGIQDIK